jgi:ribonuclease HI
MKITIYTDGGCSGNPGPGGWAFVLLAEGRDERIERNGGERSTTNNRMELTAVINALEMLPACGAFGAADAAHPADAIEAVTVFTDSQYVQKGISEWITGWKKKGWKTSSRQPVKNVDLWQRLDALAADYRIRWEWVRGHAGDPLNERCDTLVREATRAIQEKA